ncbi:unnamed protein product [Discosporangium mesarthrocarpum]
MASQGPQDPAVALEAFLTGLRRRLGLGEDAPGVRVRQGQNKVRDRDRGEYVSLDIEAWEDFLESRFKRLSVSINTNPAQHPKAEPYLTAAPREGDGGHREEEEGDGEGPGVYNAQVGECPREGGAGDVERGEEREQGDRMPDAHAEEVDDGVEGKGMDDPQKDSEDSQGPRAEAGVGEGVSMPHPSAPGAGVLLEEEEEKEGQAAVSVVPSAAQLLPDRDKDAGMGGGGGLEKEMEEMELEKGKWKRKEMQGGEEKEMELEERKEEGLLEVDKKAKMSPLLLQQLGQDLQVQEAFSTPKLTSEAGTGGRKEDGVEGDAGAGAENGAGARAGAEDGAGATAEDGVGTAAEDGAGARAENRLADQQKKSICSGEIKEGEGEGEGEDQHECWAAQSEELRGENSATDISAPEAPTPRRPCIGAVLVAVNGVRTQGLSFTNVVELLNTRERPIALQYVDSWDAIFHQHHIETQVREKISRQTFDQKLNHPLAAKLRKQIEEWMTAFREQDLRAMAAELQGNEGGGDDRMAAPTSQGPAAMLWSLIRWLEQELPEVGIFNNNHRAGGGLPVMGELQWKDVRQHLERHIFEQVFDRCMASAPDYSMGDEELMETLASLRFLRPKHWCVDSLRDTESGGSYGREWELAQVELSRLVEYRCPLDMLDCVRACVRLVALSVEASLARRQRELEAATVAAAGGLGLGSSNATKTQKVTFGADDLLAALTWVIVQANPPRLASRLWFTSYYMREGAEGLGEGAYCLTQLSSALEFARHADASVLADITEEELREGLERHTATQSMIRAAAEGNSERVSYWLGAGADPNGLSSDQQATALTAAVTHRRQSVLKVLLEGPGIHLVNPNTKICPNYGVQRGRTALMLAAAMGEMATVLALLRMPGVDRGLTCAHNKNAVDYAVQNGHMQVASVLLADPDKATLCQAAKAGNLTYVKALMLQGQDPNAPDASGQFTPLMAAAFLGHIEVMNALLECPSTDPNLRNTRGETALMYCSQREGHATAGSQVAAAVALLAKGADRYLRDREGRTAMDWARRFGSTRLLDVIKYNPQEVKIFLAARERDIRAAMALMEQGVDPNTRCPERDYTPLIAAVFNQDEDMASTLLSHRATDVNCPGRHGMTPLMYAAQAGHERMAVLLLRLRADRYRCNDKGETALEIAAVRDNSTVVNVLRYDPERLSICSAAANGDWPAVDGLLRQGISVDSRHRQRTGRGWHHERYTPLISACAQGQYNVAKRLIRAGANLNLTNLIGQTPLMYAASFGSEDLVLLLLKAGAERNATDFQGRAAVKFAETAGHEEVACILRVDPSLSTIQEAAAAGRVDEVWALMRQGISVNEERPTAMGPLFESPKVADVPDLNVRANQYRSSFEPEKYVLTPLSAAALFGRDHIVEALVSDPATMASTLYVDVRDSLGRTALMQAARFGSEGCVLKLLEHGAGRYKKGKDGMSASDLAISAGHLGIAGIINADPRRVDLLKVAAEGKVVLLKGLLKQNVQLEVLDPSSPYGTPLIASSAHGRVECVRLMLKTGAQVNRRNARGETALMHAAKAGALGVVRMLVQHGAEKDAQDSRGVTAEHWAYRGGHINMVLVKAVLGFTGDG